MPALCLSGSLLFMKIVHITTVHRPFDTRIFQKQCKSLSRSGYEVVLIAPHDREEDVDGVKILPIQKKSNRLVRVFAGSLCAMTLARKEKADLYHVHDPELLLIGKLLHFAGHRVIFDMHENFPKAVLSKTWIRPKIRPAISGVLRFFEGLLLSGLPVVFAETSYAKDYPRICQKVDVLNFPDVSCFFRHPDQKHSFPAVGYIGGVTTERGITVTLEALKILKREGLNVFFECVGPCFDKAVEVETRFAADGELKDLVRFHGYMNVVDGMQIMGKCHVGLAILKNVPNYLESYPTKMFEYMALGLPVIVSNFPLYQQIVEEEQCGICVDPHNPQEVASAIRFLLEQPDKAKMMGARGRKAVMEKYCWDKEFVKLAEFYDLLIARPSH